MPHSQTIPILITSLLSIAPASPQNIVVDADTSHAVNSFSPIRALGAGVDRLKTGSTDHVLTDPILKQVLTAGWQPVSYRQNTDLQVQAWHWNPRGTWSNSEKQEGYFTASAELGEPIRHSWAYPLPHRGFARGDGTEYSRLTDGDPATYWKSNPYLTRDFTGEDDSLHPQWVILDFGAKVDLNALRIAWANPYARRYTVQFWTGSEEPFYDGTTKGIWQTFPAGIVTNGQGGIVTLKLVSWKMSVRYVRIWMTESSNTCDTHGESDKRNCVGYAINELYAGMLAPSGQFADVVKHLPSREQTVTWPSSVDPWHAAKDLDESKGDQVGFDFFFSSGVTRGLPAIVPVAMLYSTPDDAAAEIAYLYRRHYPISRIEMGEEPDGQKMLPEDYAALYLQFATAIHRLVPEAKLGGPSFEGTNEDVEVWPDAQGRVSWLGRFLDYLKAHHRMDDLTFFSFEHYPYEACSNPWSDLYKEPRIVSHILEVWKNDGLPADLPFFMTEGNMSWQSGKMYVDIMGGLWLADYVGSMMSGGASGTYFFHYLPWGLSPECGGGSFGFFNIDKDYKITGYFSQYFAAQLISKEWVQPVDATHRLFRASSDVRDAAGNVLVTAYAVERPDGQWSLMIINKDQNNPHAVKISFTGPDRSFSGAVDRITFGTAEYQWHPNGVNGYADPDGPPAKSKVSGGRETLYQLPKASIVVLRGSLAP